MEGGTGRVVGSIGRVVGTLQHVGGTTGLSQQIGFGSCLQHGAVVGRAEGTEGSRRAVGCKG